MPTTPSPSPSPDEGKSIDVNRILGWALAGLIAAGVGFGGGTLAQPTAASEGAVRCETDVAVIRQEVSSMAEALREMRTSQKELGVALSDLRVQVVRLRREP